MTKKKPPLHEEEATVLHTETENPITEAIGSEDGVDEMEKLMLPETDSETNASDTTRRTDLYPGTIRAHSLKPIIKTRHQRRKLRSRREMHPLSRQESEKLPQRKVSLTQRAKKNPRQRRRQKEPENPRPPFA